MGGSTSKTTISNISDAITQIASSTVQDCLVSSTQDQSLQLSNTGFSLGSSYTLNQQTEVSSKCFSDTKKEATLQNNIIQQISQASTADGVAVLSAFGGSTAEATANLSSRVRSSVTMSNVQKNYNLIRQNQSAVVSNSGTLIMQKVELNQGAKVFSASVLQSLDSAGVFNDIQTHLDQKAAAKTTNPLSFISDIFTGAASAAMYFFLVVFLVIVFAVLWMYSGFGRPTPQK